jgi:hypothetical protein
VATVAEDRRTCPECGYLFEPLELSRQALPGDWTLWRGLRRLAIVLMIRGLFCLVAWSILILLVDLTVAGAVQPNSSVLGLAIMIGLCALVGFAGGVVGDRIALRLGEIAGFQSIFVTSAAIATAWIVIVAGTMLVELLHPISVSNPSVLVFIGGGIAMVWIMRAALAEEC